MLLGLLALAGVQVGTASGRIATDQHTRFEVTQTHTVAYDTATCRQTQVIKLTAISVQFRRHVRDQRVPEATYAPCNVPGVVRTRRRWSISPSSATCTRSSAAAVALRVDFSALELLDAEVWQGGDRRKQLGFLFQSARSGTGGRLVIRFGFRPPSGKRITVALRSAYLVRRDSARVEEVAIDPPATATVRLSRRS